MHGLATLVVAKFFRQLATQSPKKRRVAAAQNIQAGAHLSDQRSEKGGSFGVRELSVRHRKRRSWSPNDVVAVRQPSPTHSIIQLPSYNDHLSALRLHTFTGAICLNDRPKHESEGSAV